MGPLIEAVLSLLGTLAARDKERAWRPLVLLAYALLALVAVGLVMAWLTE